MNQKIDLFIQSIKKVKIHENKYYNIIAYGLIGGLSALIDYMVFVVLMYISEKENYLYFHVASYIIGTFISFILNSKYNFKKNNKTAQRLTKFIMVGISGLILSLILMNSIRNYLNISEYLTKIIVIILIAIFQYTLNKKITFNN